MISDSKMYSANFIVSFIKSRPVVVRLYEDKINILGAFDIWKTRNKIKKQKIPHCRNIFTTQQNNCRKSQNRYP